MRGSRPQNRVAMARQASWTPAAPPSPPVRIALPVAQGVDARVCLPGLHPFPIRRVDQDRARSCSVFLGHSQPEAAITARNRLGPRSVQGPIEPLTVDVAVIASPCRAGNQGPLLVVFSSTLLVCLPFVLTLRNMWRSPNPAMSIMDWITGIRPQISRSSQPSLVPGLRS